MYRPPAQPVQSDSDYFDQISERSDTHDAAIMGDFNMPVAKWGMSLTSHHGHDLYRNLKKFTYKVRHVIIMYSTLCLVRMKS